jgi:hypothetical protein
LKARGFSAAARLGRLGTVFAAVAVAVFSLALSASLAGAAAPVVTIESVDPGYTSAEVKGEVNSEDHETSYHFEYVDQTQYEANQWTSPQSFGFGSVAEGAGPTPVSAELTNLQAHSVYHLRLVAENTEGETAEAVAPSFETKEVAKPTLSNLTISAVDADSAHISFEVDPHAPVPNDPAFNTSWEVTCTPECGFPGGTVTSGNPEVVEVDLDGLSPTTLYSLRVTAGNAGGGTEASDSFKTSGAGLKAPLVKAFAAGPVQSSEVTLNGEVNPNGSAAIFWFEWGTQDCSLPGAGCQSIPVERDASAGDGPFYRFVSRHLAGLQPETTYHFRLMAENEIGTAEGPDEQFTTAAPPAGCANQGALGTDLLPDCRAWEMVSPPEKNGLGVLTRTDKTWLSADANAVTFSAAGNFGEVRGSSFHTTYLARRTGQPGGNGWTSHAINPLGHPVTGNQISVGVDPDWDNAFSPDLSAGIYSAAHPFGPSNVESVGNLYRIGGFADGPPTSQDLLSDAYTPVAQPLPEGFGPPDQFVKNIRPVLVGASTDLSHVYFEESLPLTPDAPLPGGPFATFCPSFGFGCPNYLYENADGQVRLVGRVPASGETSCDDDVGPACEAAPSAQAALSAKDKKYSERMVSEDGRRVYFEAPIGSKHLYLREDGKRTYAIADSAEAYDASRDGSRVFFVSGDQLSPSDSDAQLDAYMWDREAPPGERLTVLSASPDKESCVVSFIIGASDDGRYVYFVCQGSLVPGKADAFLGLNVWHDGEIAYIGSFFSGATPSRNSFRGSSWGGATEAKRGRVSSDGHHLLFYVQDSDRYFIGNGGYPGSGGDGILHLFLYNADTGRLACVNCDPSGKQPKEEPLLAVFTDIATAHVTSAEPRALSDDGRYVFFSSEEPLVAEDTNGTWDAYEYDSVRGQNYLISSGTDPSPSYYIENSPDGRDAFFLTRQQLSGWDEDGLYDLYDARVGGGLPEPAPVPAPCEGDSCLPGASAGSTAAATGSEAAGPGNPPKRCRKGTRNVRRHGHVRCLKKHRRHHHGHARKHRAANNDRRASK